MGRLSTTECTYPTYLVRPLVSVPSLVLWCAVVRRAVSCRVLTCCVVLVRAVFRCALLGCAVLRCAAPWCAALCRVPSHRAVACCALGCLVVCVALRCAAVRCTVLPRVALWSVAEGLSGPCRGVQCGSERGWLAAGGCAQVWVACPVRAVGILVCRSGWLVG